MVNDAAGNSKIYGDSRTNQQVIVVLEPRTTNNFSLRGLSGMHSLSTGQVNTGSGGTVSTGTGPGGGGVGSAGSGSTDKFGVVARYATGEILYTFRENFRSDGLRFDFQINSADRFAECELRGYYSLSKQVDDEVSGKMSGGKHSGDGTRVNTYDIGVEIRTGKTRYRIEEIHPEYSGSVHGGTGKALTSSFLGYNFIKYNKPSSVILEVWQDQGNNEGSSPANQWVKIAGWTVNDPVWHKARPDHQETIRVDEVSTSSLKWKWLAVHEIKGTGGTPAPGGGGGTTPPTTGGGTTFHEIACTSGNQQGQLVFNTSSGYASGKVNTNHATCASNGFMQDSKDFKQIEYTGYFKVVKSNSNGKLTIKARGGNTNGCEGCGVGLQLGFDGSYRAYKIRRYADEFTYTNWQNGIGDIQGKWIGYKACFYNVQGGVKYELYLDTNESNSWRRVFEVVDNGTGSLAGGQSACGGVSGQPITWGGPLVFFEWVGSVDPDGVIFKRISLREIDPTISGGTGSTPGTPTGPAPDPLPPFTPGQPYVPGQPYDPSTGTYPIPGGGQGGVGGNAGTGIDTPDTQEQEIMYERKVFQMRWNINFKSGDACGLGKDPATAPLLPIWSNTGDVFVDFKNYSRCGLYVAFDTPGDETKTSMWIDRTARQWKINMKKQGNNTLTGNISIVIRDTDYNTVAVLGTIAAGSLTGNEETITVDFPLNTRKFKKGDHLSVEYTGNTQDDFLRVKVSQTDKIDSANTMLFVYDGADYIYDPNADMGGIISI